MEFWTGRQLTTLRSDKVFHHFSKTYFQWQNYQSYVGESCNTLIKRRIIEFSVYAYSRHYIHEHEA